MLDQPQIPLFPLGTALFPVGPLPLRIFEPRYLALVSRCLREDREFGVLLIVSGTDTRPAQTVEIGTLAKITDWYQGSDGILGVTAQGTSRFRVRGVDQQDDGLYVGQVELLPPEDRVPLPADFEPMAVLLETIIDDLGKLYESIERRYDDATWVGCRLAEILPMPSEDKQHCLEVSDPIERLQYLRPMLRAIRRNRTQ